MRVLDKGVPFDRLRERALPELVEGNWLGTLATTVHNTERRR